MNGWARQSSTGTAAGILLIASSAVNELRPYFRTSAGIDPVRLHGNNRKSRCKSDQRLFHFSPQVNCCRLYQVGLSCQACGHRRTAEAYALEFGTEAYHLGAAQSHIINRRLPFVNGIVDYTVQ